MTHKTGQDGEASFQASVQRAASARRSAKSSDSSDRQVIINKTSLGTIIMSTSRNECLILLVNQRKGSDDGSKSELLCNESLIGFEFLTPIKRHRQEPKTDQNTSTFYCHHTLSKMFTACWVHSVLIPCKLPKVGIQPAWSPISRTMPAPPP